RAAGQESQATRRFRARSARAGADLLGSRTCPSGRIEKDLMDAFLTSEGLLSLATLTAMEIVLGIDNVVFIAIMVGRLPAGQRQPARRVALVLAVGLRIGLLFTISWIMGLNQPLFEALGRLSGRDLILLGGGLFLIFKATWEIYDKLEVDHVE